MALKRPNFIGDPGIVAIWNSLETVNRKYDLLRDKCVQIERLAERAQRQTEGIPHTETDNRLDDLQGQCFALEAGVRKQADAIETLNRALGVCRTDVQALAKRRYARRVKRI